MDVNIINPDLNSLKNLTHKEKIQFAGCILGQPVIKSIKKANKPPQTIITWVLNVDNRYQINLTAWNDNPNKMKKNDVVQVFGTTNVFKGIVNVNVTDYLINPSNEQCTALQSLINTNANLEKQTFDYGDKYNDISVVPIRQLKDEKDEFAKPTFNWQRHGYNNYTKLVKIQGNIIKFENRSQQYPAIIGSMKKLKFERNIFKDKDGTVVSASDVRYRHILWIDVKSENIVGSGLSVQLWNEAAEILLGLPAKQWMDMSPDDQA
eukprot:595913_1